jgi:hypothetical protein
VTVAKVIRYKTKPESADENERLILDVFAELKVEQPGGLHYATLRLPDGVSFLHIAVLDGEANPLFDSAAFGVFQSKLGDRLVEGPEVSDATVIDSFRFLSS